MEWRQNPEALREGIVTGRVDIKRFVFVCVFCRCALNVFLMKLLVLPPWCLELMHTVAVFTVIIIIILVLIIIVIRDLYCTNIIMNSFEIFQNSFLESAECVQCM